MRWSPSMPSSSRSALASAEAREATAAKVVVSGPSACHDVTWVFAWMVRPYSRILATESGMSCIVLRMRTG